MQSRNPHTTSEPPCSPGTARCGARRRDGSACRSKPMANGRCRMHGGPTPTGFGLPQTKHGRYSKDMPARIAGDYAAMLADAEIGGLRDELALASARIGDLLRRCDPGESGAAWDAAKAALGDFKAAIVAGNGAGLRSAIQRLEKLIERGESDYAAWREVFAVIEHRRRLSDSEAKHQERLQTSITVERAMLWLGAVVGIIKSHVTDRETLAAIARDLQRLDEPGGRQYDTSGTFAIERGANFES